MSNSEPIGENELAMRSQRQLARESALRDRKPGTVTPIHNDEVVSVSSLKLTDDMYGKRRMRFGFDTLDEIAPLFQTTMSVLGARTGVGKTSLARNVAITNARDGAKVLYASLEFRRARMHAEFMQELMRMSKAWMYREAETESFSFRQAEKELASFGDNLLLWHPEQGARMADIFKRVEKYNPDLLIIDYARTILDWRGRERAEELTHQLANFTMKRPMHTMLLQQLSREADGIRPGTIHLADSDVLGQRADQIFLVWRPMEQRGSGVHDTLMEVIPTKNRFGPTNVRRHLHWTGEVQGIDGFSREEEAMVPDCCRTKGKKGEPKPTPTLAPVPVPTGMIPVEEWPTQEPVEETWVDHSEPIAFWNEDS